MSDAIVIHKKASVWNTKFKAFLATNPSNDLIVKYLHTFNGNFSKVDYILSELQNPDSISLVVLLSGTSDNTALYYEFDGIKWFGESSGNANCINIGFGQVDSAHFNPIDNTLLATVKAGARVSFMCLAHLTTGESGEECFLYKEESIDGKDTVIHSSYLYDVKEFGFINGYNTHTGKQHSQAFNFVTHDGTIRDCVYDDVKRTFRVILSTQNNATTIVPAVKTTKQYMEEIAAPFKGAFDVKSSELKPLEEKEAPKPVTGLEVSGIAERIAYLENLCAERAERIQQESLILERDEREMYLLKELLALHKS